MSHYKDFMLLFAEHIFPYKEIFSNMLNGSLIHSTSSYNPYHDVQTHGYFYSDYGEYLQFHYICRNWFEEYQ